LAADEAAKLVRCGSPVITGGGDSAGEGDRRALQLQSPNKRVDDEDGDAVQHEGVVASLCQIHLAVYRSRQRSGWAGMRMGRGGGSVRCGSKHRPRPTPMGAKGPRKPQPPGWVTEVGGGARGKKSKYFRFYEVASN
jgi:hypothetical protein